MFSPQQKKIVARILLHTDLCLHKRKLASCTCISGPCNFFSNNYVIQVKTTFSKSFQIEYCTQKLSTFPYTSVKWQQDSGHHGMDLKVKLQSQPSLPCSYLLYLHLHHGSLMSTFTREMLINEAVESVLFTDELLLLLSFIPY